MSKVINIFGGPGIGKTTLAAEIFVILKKMGLEAVNIGEYAKDKTWEKNHIALQNQLYIFGHQHYMMYLVNNKVDFMVCDSPLLLSALYSGLGSDDTLYKLIIEEFNKFDNVLNILLQRSFDYSPIGRNQNLEEAIEVDEKMKKLLDDNNIEYIEYNVKEDTDDIIYEKIMKNI